jgi:hypothetical protein
MNRRYHTARRAFLRGAGGILVGLPFLEAFAPKQARAQGGLTRMLVVYSPNGTNSLPEFMPDRTGTNYTFGAETEPLTPYKSKLLVISGLQIKHRTHGGDLHTVGIACMLTGIAGRSDDQFSDNATSVGGGWAGGISVDQEIAKHIGNASRYRSLQFGVASSIRYGNHPIGRISYTGAAQPVAPEESPAAAYARLFADTTTPTAPDMLDANLKRDKSVMDFVIKEFGEVSTIVSAADKHRLDQHVTMLRELERSLGVAPVSNLSSCTSTSFTPDGDPNVPADFPRIAKQQRELLVLALACNLTRVASLQYSYARSLQAFPWLTLSSDHHTMSHEIGGGAGVSAGRGDTEDDRLIRINRWYATELAGLLQSLDSVDEGGATLLDNCVGWWCSDVADGKGHSWTNLRAFLFGSAGGRINTGQHVMYGSEGSNNDPESDAAYGWNNSEPHNKLHVTLLNAFGIPTNTFGDATVGSGPLAGLLK